MNLKFYILKGWPKNSVFRNAFEIACKSSGSSEIVEASIIVFFVGGFAKSVMHESLKQNFS